MAQELGLMPPFSNFPQRLHYVLVYARGLNSGTELSSLREFGTHSVLGTETRPDSNFSRESKLDHTASPIAHPSSGATQDYA